jgi:hypothetical protein
MNRKVVVSSRVVYHKYAQVEVEIPNEVKKEDIHQWLLDNSDKYDEALDYQISDSHYELGFGLDYGMSEMESETETRYDVFEDEKQVNGGHV